MAKIIGNTTATPNPRPDWLQNDEKKADYIKNKPDVVTWSDVDSEIDFDSTNPIQNSTVAWRFNEFNQSLKDYADGQNSKQDEKLNELTTLVTETMKATAIDENSTDEQYSTAKAVYDMNQSTIEYIDNQNNTQDEEFTKLVTETVKTTTIDNSSTNDKYPTAKATYDFVKAETASMVDSAPETLDTLNELAAALGDDPNFATTVATQIGKKADKEVFDGHIDNKENPHEVTLTQLGVIATDTELNYIKGVKSNIQTQLDGTVPNTRTINNKELTSDISLTYKDVGADQSGSAAEALEDAKAYADKVVAQQSRVQIITWEAND